MLDPLDHSAGPDTTWTTVNLAEAFPGVPTPLGWTWAWKATEYGMRWTFADLGALSKRRAEPPDTADKSFITIFRGKATANLDQFRAMGDAMPGGSANGVEKGLFGSVRPGMTNRPNRRRYPIVAVKLPITALRSRRGLRGFGPTTTQWWREHTRPDGLPTAGVARRALIDAQDRNAEIARSHGAISIIAQALYEQIRALCERNELSGLESQVATFGIEESRVIEDVVRLSRGRLALPDFLAIHGYHGPREGEITSLSWREDPTPITGLLGAYAAGAVSSPEERGALRRREKIAARRELLSRLGPVDAIKLRILLALGSRYLPLREQGRATFLKTYDVARAAVRVLGEHLADRGVLDSPDDIAYLTFDEVVQSTPPDDARELVVFRKQRQSRYMAEQLPAIWTGQVSPLAAEPDRRCSETATIELIGLAASIGNVEGRVRVITDPADTDSLEHGEILVCHTTDPSWAPALYIAAAAVIDVGGLISHGAIVARELGIPCVINTRHGTTRLHTGQFVRVDGRNGIVTVLSAVSQKVGEQ